MSTQVALIGYGSGLAANPAPLSSLGALYDVVASLNPPASRYVILNGYGEALGPSAHATWTPEAVAAWVRAGHLWVDWCGWPMYWQVEQDRLVQLGAAGFARFLRALGLHPQAVAAGFVVPASSNLQGYPSDRGFPLNPTTTRAPWYPATRGTGSDGLPLAAGGYTRLAALRTAAGGWWLYAATLVGLLPPPFQSLAGSLTAQDVGLWVHRALARDSVPAGAPPPVSACTAETLRRGDTGPCVRRLQTALNAVDGAGLLVDGVFGPDTAAAVEDFQRGQGLTVTGVVNAATWRALAHPVTQGACPSGYTRRGGACVPVQSAPPPPTQGGPSHVALDLALAAAGAVGVGALFYVIAKQPPAPTAPPAWPRTGR